MPNEPRPFLSTMWKFKKSITILLVPLLLLPLLIIGDSKALKCAYVVCVMAVYWATEACPLPVTSLLPVVLFPLLGIQSADAVSMNYMRNINFLAVGTVTICIAFEEWNLHKRFALRVLLFFGSRPCWIMLGLMIITAVFSMWLSNISAVALMYPVAMAVCKEIELAGQKRSKLQRNTTEMKGLCSDREDKVSISDDVPLEGPREFESEAGSENDKPVTDGHVKKKAENLEKAVLIAVAYSSTLGGICTTVGTPPNFIAIGILGTTYGGKADEINFMTWFGFCFPLSALLLLIAWIWMQIRFLNIRDLRRTNKDQSSTAVQAMLRSAYDSLPPMGFADIAIAIHLSALILLWFFRDPKIFPGWKDLFPGSYSKDSTAAVLIGLSVFMFPSKPSSFRWIWKRTNDDGPSPPLLEWKTFQQKFPWDVIFLLGSGFALAGGCVDSGLSGWFGQQLVVLKGMPPWVVTLVITATVSILTEFTSNTATASIFLPIVLAMSKEMEIHPILVLLATTLSCSFAFSLPTATPVNAMAFSYDVLRVKDLILAGLPMNLVSVAFLNLFIHFIGVPMFGLDVMPDWAMTNSTMSTSTTVP